MAARDVPEKVRSTVRCRSDPARSYMWHDNRTIVSHIIEIVKNLSDVKFSFQAKKRE